MNTYNFIEAVKQLSKGIPVVTVVCGRTTTIIMEDDNFLCVEYNAPLLNYFHWDEIVALEYADKTLPTVGTVVLVPSRCTEGYTIGKICEITNLDNIKVQCGDKTIYTRLSDIGVLEELIGTDILLN